MRSGRGGEAPSAAPPEFGLCLTYNQAGQVHVTGPVTGERYAFDGSDSALEVNPRDVGALLRSGLFRRA